MLSVKRWLTTMTAMAMLFSATGADLQAQGTAYSDSQNAASISPEWAFGGLLALSLAVILLQNSSGGHSH